MKKLRSFGNWEPDAPDIMPDDAPALDIARNMYPGPNGSWLAARDLDPYSDSAMEDDEVPLNMCHVQKSDGSFDTYVFTNRRYYKYDADNLAFIDKSKPGGYVVPDDDRVSFARYGSLLIASQLGDVPQAIDIDGAGTFDDLANAPVSKFVEVMDNRVVFSCLDEDPRMIRWSDIDDPEEYSLGAAGQQVFPDMGHVMGFFPRARLVVMEGGKHIITSTGDLTSFDFTEKSGQKGTTAPWSCFELGSNLYWRAEDGFYAGNADGEVNITEHKVESYLSELINRDRHFQIFGTFDPYTSHLLWAIPVEDNEFNDRIIVYDWSLKRFSEIEMDTYLIQRVATPGISLEGGSDPMDLDAPDQPSFDSQIYRAGAPVLTAVGTDKKLSSLDGTILVPTWRTKTLAMGMGDKTLLKRIMPLVSGSGARGMTVNTHTRDHMADDWEINGARTQQRSGWHKIHQNARFHRMDFTIPSGDWEKAQGYFTEHEMTSER